MAASIIDSAGLQLVGGLLGSNLLVAWLTHYLSRNKYEAETAKNQADTAKSIAEAYEKLVRDLRDEIRENKLELRELRDKIEKLEKRASDQSRIITNMAMKEKNLLSRIQQVEQENKELNNRS